MLFPNYRRSVIKSLIVVLFEFPLFLGLILALVIYWNEKDFELMMDSIMFCLLMLMIFCFRIPLLIGGIKKMYLLKRGEVIDADLLYFKWRAGVTIIKVKYTYLYKYKKYVKKEIYRYCQCNRIRLRNCAVDETKDWQNNVKVPIVVYKGKSFMLFHHIGLYDELYHGITVKIKRGAYNL